MKLRENSKKLNKGFKTETISVEKVVRKDRTLGKKPPINREFDLFAV